jgi:uncharacterized membrane protein YphA (DoxX/SURF4 family)
LEASTKYGTLILRIGMSLVFYWFGIKQILDPNMFSFYVPDFAIKIFGSAQTASFYNGILEVILATLLIIGLFTKLSALILAIHLAAITIIIGFTPTGVRDFGLTVATTALVFFNPGKYSVDEYIKDKFPDKLRKYLLLN